ncbi:MAG: YIP1 family protein [Archaeoglobales archaeon]|nr:YIP1 family protein [Archaeoglobales archaeon]
MDVLLNPDKFFSERKNIGYKVPLLIVLLAAILGVLSVYFTVDLTIQKNFAEFGLKIDEGQMGMLRGIALVFGSITAFAGVFIGWIIITALLYLFSAIFGGKGNFSTLLKFTAFSYIPQIILTPITAYLTIESLSQALAGAKLDLGTLIAPTIFGIVVLLWQYVYWVFAVKNARELNFNRSAISAGILVAIFIGFQAIGLLLSQMIPQQPIR